MSDDLVKRLRTPVGFQDLPYIQEEAADTIDALTAKLAEVETRLAQAYRGFDDRRARMNALRFRLRVPEGMKLPFDLIDTFYVPPSDKVFVLIITKGNAVVLEDSVELYPSDTLLTQIRLIE